MSSEADPVPVLKGKEGQAQNGQPAGKSKSSLAPSAWVVSLFTLVLVFSLHLSSLLLFNSGFLLNRLTLSNRSKCPASVPSSSISLTDPSSETCTLPPTHSRVVFVLIDALRWDFIFPHSTNSTLYNPSHHNILTLPSELTTTNPSNSFLFKGVADPPTTTLQRLKGLTTGTLPTFIDAGSNFGGARVDEDSWIEQAKNSGKRVGMMGDDTWITVFSILDNEDSPGVSAHQKLGVSGPTSGLGAAGGDGGVFERNLTFPFDSFNVEDLDTVDEGVERNLLPLLERKGEERGWEVLIGHFLGLDHAGHRFGATHPQMTRKLKQYDLFLRKVVDNLESDDLLVVLGDHGMDGKGDHGGDSEEEIWSGMWVYSKDLPLVREGSGEDGVQEKVQSFLQDAAMDSQAKFHYEAAPLGYGSSFEDPKFRTVPQIALVPTISLLLGLPIPFNNLGTIIPELFYRPTRIPQDAGAGWDSERTLVEALRINSKQVMRYVEAHVGEQESGGGGDLDRFVPELRGLFDDAEETYRGFRESGGYGGGSGILDKVLGSRSSSSTSHEAALKTALSYLKFTTTVLSRCRTIWAKFDTILMLSGLICLFGALFSTLKLVSCIREGVGSLEFGKGQLAGCVVRGLQGGVGGILVGGLGSLGISMVGGVGLEDLALLKLRNLLLLGWCVGFEAAVLLYGQSKKEGEGSTGSTAPPPRRSLFGKIRFQDFLGASILLIHTCIFASNSFILWEDKLSLYLLLSPVVLYIIPFLSLSAPSSRLRFRILSFSLLFVFLMRALSYSTICREEQHPYCSTTFYGNSGTALASNYIMILLIPNALALPTLVRRFLSISKSDQGPASFFLEGLFRSITLGSAFYWAVEWVIATFGNKEEEIFGFGGEADKRILTDLKTILARMLFLFVVIAAGPAWALAKLNIQVQREEVADGEAPAGRKKTQVTIIGFANTFGSTYLLFFASIFGLVFLLNQPTGQVVLSAGLLGILCFLEVIDSKRDSEALLEDFSSRRNAGDFLSSSDAASTGLKGVATARGETTKGPTFLEIALLAVLGHLLFFSTGHQAVLSSIQWRVAFVGFQTVTYPWSPILVVLNTLGPFIITTLALPLLVFWNISPRLPSSPSSPPTPLPLQTRLLKSSLLLSFYFSLVCFSAAVFAAYFRRHLMVWKVFAPRFMLSGIVVLMVDLCLVIGVVGWGGKVTLWKVERTLMGKFD